MQTVTTLGSTSARLLAALAALPTQVLPRLFHVGRIISLPPSVAAPATPPRLPHAHDHLAPSHVSGRLASHRMVSYRLRISGVLGHSPALSPA